MPIEFRCVNCQKLLRVVDAAVGKKARCPDCGTIQEARAGAGTELNSSSYPPESPPPFSIGATPIPPVMSSGVSPQNPFADQSTSRSPFGQSAINPYQSPQVAGSAAQVSREAALAKVQAPATGLLVMAVILIGFQLIGTVVIVLTGAWGGAGLEDLIPQAIGMIVGLGISALTAFGAVKMRRLESYPLAMTAAVIAMLPCSGCCILSLPLGIWALVVLLDAQVKQSFR